MQRAQEWLPRIEIHPAQCDDGNESHQRHGALKIAPKIRRRVPRHCGEQHRRARRRHPIGRERRGDVQRQVQTGQRHRRDGPKQRDSSQEPRGMLHE